MKCVYHILKWILPNSWVQPQVGWNRVSLSIKWISCSQLLVGEIEWPFGAGKALVTEHMDVKVPFPWFAGFCMCC